jgi:hypothetical protein
VDGDDHIRIVERYHDSAWLPVDESTVAPVSVLVEILFERIPDNGFRFFSGSLDPAQSVLGVVRESHALLRARGGEVLPPVWR